MGGVQPAFHELLRSVVVGVLVHEVVVVDLGLLVLEQLVQLQLTLKLVKAGDGR